VEKLANYYNNRTPHTDWHKNLLPNGKLIGYPSMPQFGIDRTSARNMGSS